MLEEDELLDVELLDDELLEELLEEELLDELFGDPFPPQPSRDRDKSADMAKRARVRRWFLSLINIKHRIIFIDDSFNPFEFKKSAEILFRELPQRCMRSVTVLGFV